jgi:hypothetical protein
MLNRKATFVLFVSLLFAITGCPYRKPAPKKAGTTSVAGEQDARGRLEGVNAKSISGWAWDPEKPDEPVEVDIYAGDELLTTITAEEFRQELVDARRGNGQHHFTCPTPAELRDGRSHLVHARVAGTDVELKGSPRIVQFIP